MCDDDASDGASLSPNGYTAGEMDACSLLEGALEGVSWDSFGQAPGVGDDSEEEIAQATAPITAVAGQCRIMCLGDSLTAGYCGLGATETPWADALADELNRLSDEASDEAKQELPTDAPADPAKAAPRCTARALGLVGMTTGEIADVVRQTPAVMELESTDVAIIMAGTNDIGSMHRPADVVAAAVANLRQIHRVYHEAGVHTVALTVIESKGARKLGWLKDLHAELNAATKAAFGAKDAPAGGFRAWSAVVDMCTVMGGFDPDGGLWAADGLHLTARGYAEFGRRLGRQLHGTLSCHCAGRREPSREPHRSEPHRSEPHRSEPHRSPAETDAAARAAREAAAVAAGASLSAAAAACHADEAAKSGIR